MKVVISGRFDEQVLERVKQDWQVVRLVPTPEKWRLSKEELIDALVDADVFLTEGDGVTAEVLAASPRLKAVVACRGNPVNVDVPAATAAGIGRNPEASR